MIDNKIACVWVEESEETAVWGVWPPLHCKCNFSMYSQQHTAVWQDNYLFGFLAYITVNLQLNLVKQWQIGSNISTGSSEPLEAFTTQQSCGLVMNLKGDVQPRTFHPTVSSCIPLQCHVWINHQRKLNIYTMYQQNNRRLFFNRLGNIIYCIKINFLQ